MTIDPTSTAVRLRFPGGVEATVRIEPDLDEHIKAVNAVLDILGGEVYSVQPAGPSVQQEHERLRDKNRRIRAERQAQNWPHGRVSVSAVRKRKAKSA